MITEQEMKDLEEIRRLLDEAYDHYFTNSDGYCKSSEGYISLGFNNFFDRANEEPFKLKNVEIYSYVFGPNRANYFDSTAEALETVKQWHEREMQEDYEDNEEKWLAGWGFEPEYDWLDYE